MRAKTLFKSAAVVIGALFMLLMLPPLLSNAAEIGATLPVSLAFAPLMVGTQAPTILRRFKDALCATGRFFYDAKATDRFRGETGAKADLFRTEHGALWRGPVDNPQDPGRIENVDVPVYDSSDWAAATTQDFLFRTIGTKTLIQTNMVQPGQLPGPETLYVKRFSLQIQTAVIADLILLANNILFSFFASRKLYMQCQIGYLPAGFGPYGFTTANNTGIMTNGLPAFSAGRDLFHDVPLAPGENFYGQLDGFNATTHASGAPTPSATTPIYCYLNGPFVRAT